MAAELSYDDALTRESRDLVALALSGRLKKPVFRDAEVKRMIDAIQTRRSVVLVGPVGVGKTTVVHGLAYAIAAQSKKDPIFEYSTTLLLANTKYLGELETKITKVLDAARAKGGILYFKDLWNLASAGVTRHSTRSALDAFRPYIDQGKIVLIGEVTAEQWRQMMRTQVYGSLLEQLAIAPLPAEAADKIVEAEAEHLGLEIDAPTRSAMSALSRRFSPAVPEPGPTLRLLDQISSYAEEKEKIGEKVTFDRDFVEKVFSIYSGLPLFVVSQRATVRAQEIRDWFKSRIVGQEEAIESVVETISLFKAGMNDPTKPLGTMLFVGPTGVGKTEVARALATYLFGSPSRLLRFDLGEFKDYSSFESLLGSRDDPSRPAILLDPVRAQPFQVVLFDELEKAHHNIWDTMLSLLEEGRLSSPTGETVDFKSTIVVCTSNVGAEDSEKSLGFGAKGEGKGDKVLLGLRQHFRPELLNRFQHIVVFHPLTRDQVKKVARQELARVLGREGLTGRNLVVDVDEAAIDLVIERGYDARFGARALKRELQRQIVLPLAVALMEHRTEPGQVLKVTGKEGAIRVRVLDTEVTREARKDRAPVRARDGHKLAREDLPQAIKDVTARIEALGAEVHEADLRATIKDLEAKKLEAGFWSSPADASRVLEAIESQSVVLGRLDHLRIEAESLAIATKSLEKREKVESWVRRLEDLQHDVDRAWIELGLLGEVGRPDAIVEIEPVGGAKGQRARNLLFDTYKSWAEWRGHEVTLLREPITGDEPILILIRGGYASGYLAGENGLHRVQKDEEPSVARVTTIPRIESLHAAYPIDPQEMRALKMTGQFGGKIRSRLDAGAHLVLANERTLAANRELAIELWPSWCARPERSDQNVRRYDLDTPLFTDANTGRSTGKPDTLSPPRFHQLLSDGVSSR